MIEKIEHKGKEYRVGYYHKIIEDNKKVRATTTAFIKDDDDNVIVKGIANCSIKDQFSKKMGRRIAKGRMIKALSEL